MEMTNVAAIVTGAASGLGAATAAELAKRGARVFGVDLQAAIDAAPPAADVTYIAADVTRYEQVEAAVSAAAAEAPLRIAVNCAGIAPSARVLSRSGVHDPAMFARVVNVNLIGTFHVLTAAAEQMAALDADSDGQRGVVINTASVAAFEGQIGQIAYAASKGGVIAMGLPAARDLSQVGIRVNTIAPGIVETPMLQTVSEDYRAALAASVPFPKRLAQPAEYAQLAAFIVQHDYLNGEVIRMDGALRMAPR